MQIMAMPDVRASSPRTRIMQSQILFFVSVAFGFVA
jgi:hypothetical protein